MRTAFVCLLALLTLALCGGPAVATSKTKKPATACQKLAKRYKDRAPDRRLVLVVRGSDETGRISACVLPSGKVRTVTSWDDGLARDSAAIVATAGLWVLVEDAHSDQYGGVSRALTRVDVRSGRRLLLSSYGCMLDYSQPSCPDGTSYGKVGIAPSGAGAYEVSDLASHTTTLRGFSPAGIFATLADGPVEALRVTSTQVFWTQAGVEHQAPLLP
ncbi:MAG: hypothetical protein QOJ46_1225 [bacterium]|jgi:hypothetical protein